VKFKNIIFFGVTERLENFRVFGYRLTLILGP
jgi:hypothetical protein